MRHPIFSIVFSALLFSCSQENKSHEYENAAVKCWGQTWLPVTDPSGEMFIRGMDSIDLYLRSQGMLGNGSGADYVKFGSVPGTVVIPVGTPGYRSMQMAIHSDNAGAFDVNSWMNCINENVMVHLGEMDSTDALYRWAVRFKTLESAGAPDAGIFRDYYMSLSVEEMNRPLIKYMFYFTYCQRKIYTAEP